MPTSDEIKKTSTFDVIKMAISCQLMRLKSVGKLCKKGLSLRGCRRCLKNSMDFLYRESDGVNMKNCEKYAQEIHDAVMSAMKAGLNSSCAMYKYRTDGDGAFDEPFATLADSIVCDGDCDKCSLDTLDWLVADVE